MKESIGQYRSKTRLHYNYEDDGDDDNDDGDKMMIFFRT